MTKREDSIIDDSNIDRGLEDNSLVATKTNRQNEIMAWAALKNP